MKLLLDTNVMLWLLASPERINSRVRDLLHDRVNDLFVSSASIWEVAIKISIGKLEIDPFWLEELINLDVKFLPIEMHHAWLVGDLPFHHRDPFDRLLVAQAQIEQATLVTSDAILSRYGVPVLLV